MPPRPDDLLELLAKIHDLAPEHRPAAAAELEPSWRDAILGLLAGPEPDAALQRLLSLANSPAKPQRTPEPQRSGPRTPRTPSTLGLLDRPPSRSLTDLLHQGSYPARLMRLLEPAEVHALLADPPSDELAITEQLTIAIAKHGIEAGLGQVRTREYLRLARRELEHAALEEVGGALSDLSAACIDAALRSVDPALLEHVTVFGMGKLGGRELNFLSDIDLVFVHADEPSSADDNAAHRARGRLQDQLRKVVKLLEGSGVWRPLFHVDLRLRPFGTRGPLTISASALEHYYERHGRGWERQVWLRARPIAGNLPLGELVLDRLGPFVWPRSVGPEVFDEIGAMMKRARAQAHTGIGGSAVDLKHDAGGIREVEFFVQALQRLHGGRNRSVRTRSTLDGLDRLAAAGLLSDREHAALGTAYRVLRRIEHRLQLAEGQQTHRLPESIAGRELLAARLAVLAGRNWLPGDRVGFDAGLAELRGQVQAITVTLTGESELAGELPAARELARAVVVDPGASPNLRVHALIDLGLRPEAAEESAALLEHLFARPYGPFESHGEGRTGAQNLLLACLDSADPEQALARLIEFNATRPSHFGVWRILAASDQQPLVRRIADLFGASEPLSRGLIGFPGPHGGAPDGGLALLMEASVGDLPSKDELDGQWAKEALAARELPASELDDRLLLFKHRQLVRIGLTDLGRRPDPLDVGRVLSDLADLILAEILADLARASRTSSDQPGFSLAVFALGKFGMQAMDYGSDLDLLFVFEPLDEGPATQIREDAQRIARQLIGRLEQRIRGVRLYEVDMRLRPSGQQGLLVSSLEGFRSYHARPLEVWERLALVWLRPVAEAIIHRPASSASLAERVVSEVVPASLWPSVADPDRMRSTIASDTRRLKQRIEREISRETRDSLDVKTGVGGCLEFELLVAAMQLGHGRERPELRSHELPIALARIAEAGLIDPNEASELDRAYRFERLLLNRLRMTRGSAWGETDRLTVNSPRLTALARRMGLADTDALVSTLTRHRATIRAAFDRHLPPANVP